MCLWYHVAFYSHLGLASFFCTSDRPLKNQAFSPDSALFHVHVLMDQGLCKRYLVSSVDVRTSVAIWILFLNMIGQVVFEM